MKNKNSKSRVEKQVCPTCQREFMGRVDRPSGRCSRQCFFENKDYRKLRSEIIKPRNLIPSNTATWRGGRHSDEKGYVLIYMPSHPKTKDGRYVYEHRLVMEKHLGRYLKSKEVVHHINGIKSDNRIENLEVTNQSKHASEHLSQRNRKRYAKKP